MNEEELVRCPNCDAQIAAGAALCPRCGAKQLPPRVIFGAKREEFRLTLEEEPFEFPESREMDDRDPRIGPPPDHGHAPGGSESVAAVRWGGFRRRAVARLIDLIVLAALGAVMFSMSYIGYKVGLLAHGKSVNLSSAPALVTLLTWGWILLCTAYFVVFHAMQGQTVGKWLLGLRVVGPEQQAVGYRQALLRWLVEFALAPILIGYLWPIFSREKRALHDWAARTWVIRT